MNYDNVNTDRMNDGINFCGIPRNQGNMIPFTVVKSVSNSLDGFTHQLKI